MNWNLHSALSQCVGGGGEEGGPDPGGGRGGFKNMTQFSLEEVYTQQNWVLSRSGGTRVLLYSSLHDLFRPIKVRIIQSVYTHIKYI